MFWREKNLSFFHFQGIGSRDNAEDALFDF